MNREDAMHIWDSFFGKGSIQAIDALGYKIFKNAYGDNNNEYGWNIDHIWASENPAQAGSDSIYNLQPLSIYANNLKSNNNKGTIGIARFSVIDYGTDEYGKKIGKMYVKFEDWPSFREAYNYPWI